MKKAERDGKDGKLIAGNLYILAATFFWGINYSFIKSLINADWMSSFNITGVRLIGGCLLFWLVSFFIKDKEKIPRDDMIRLFLGGFICLFCNILFFVTSLRYGSAIDISIIQTLPPVFVILIRIIFKHDRPSWLVYAGVIVSFIGAALVIMTGSHSASSHASNYLLGDGLAVVSSLCFAFYLVTLSGPAEKYNPVIMMRWVFLYAAIPALALVPGIMDMNLMYCSEAVPWLEIGFILIGPTFLSYLLTNPAEKDIGSVMVSLYQYLTPVVAALFAVLMGIDKLRWMQVVAMLIIIGGMILSNIGKKKGERKAR